MSGPENDSTITWKEALEIWKNRGEESFNLALTLAWQIWRRRNSKVFDGKIIQNHSTINNAMATVLSLSKAKEARCGGKMVQVKSQPRWCLPMEGCVKVNVDAGFLGNGGVGLGAVMRDHRGRVVSTVALRTEFRWSTLVAELKANSLGLQLARKTGASAVIIESDNITATRIAKGSICYRNECRCGSRRNQISNWGL